MAADHVSRARAQAYTGPILEPRATAGLDQPVTPIAAQLATVCISESEAPFG
jgi:hypothetical protein